MSAFDTVLSAGKIIEFLVENTIVVNEEQRLLRAALESTVLLVQMANGVNTITAETTDIVVPQEQGRLLAQYNTPTN
jgi:transcriptional regulator CtsR